MLGGEFEPGLAADFLGEDDAEKGAGDEGGGGFGDGGEGGEFWVAVEGRGERGSEGEGESLLND